MTAQNKAFIFTAGNVTGDVRTLGQGIPTVYIAAQFFKLGFNSILDVGLAV